MPEFSALGYKILLDEDIALKHIHKYLKLLETFLAATRSKLSDNKDEWHKQH